MGGGLNVGMAAAKPFETLGNVCAPVIYYNMNYSQSGDLG